MAIESVVSRTVVIPDGLTKQELYFLLTAMVSGIQAIATKLDADTGVTDTNYAATLATFIVK